MNQSFEEVEGEAAFVTHILLESEFTSLYPSLVGQKDTAPLERGLRALLK